MDIRCSTCNEPWDVDHLWFDEIFETDIPGEEAESWRDLPTVKKLSDRYRQKFAANGWEFGRTIINVIRCPACPKDVRADPAIVAIKAGIEDVLGDDQDGLAATFEDLGM
jgi:hypothetical protein